MKKLKEKQEIIRILGRMYDILENEMRDAIYDYAEVGRETQQKKHWQTGELMWEDDEKTIPRFDPIYDWVKKNPEDISDRDRILISAIEKIESHLDKLL